ncbi:unnamed protein product [Caenorhabditis auriculariae]|uniref:FERM domain-containing protein n=1 Tax=Caenorhabditis auriculariae TaxID=2777116 RepID=A0A8S1H2M5_9PELO|nr:unnamed protein product [Caenorhabditis auriculariae]
MNAYKKGVLLTDNKKDTAAFAAILARKLYGRTFKPKPENVTKMYPDYMLRKDRDKLANRLGKAMKLLEDKQDDDLELEFVKMARNVITYGAWFFLVNVKLVKARAGKNGDESHVGVNDNGLHIISTQTRKVKTFQFEEFIPSGDPKNPTVLKVETRNAAFLIESPFVRFLKKILTKFHPSFEFSSQPKPVATSLSI